MCDKKNEDSKAGVFKVPEEHQAEFQQLAEAYRRSRWDAKLYTNRFDKLVESGSITTDEAIAMSYEALRLAELSCKCHEKLLSYINFAIPETIVGRWTFDERKNEVRPMENPVTQLLGGLFTP